MLKYITFFLLKKPFALECDITVKNINHVGIVICGSQKQTSFIVYRCQSRELLSMQKQSARKLKAI